MIAVVDTEPALAADWYAHQLQLALEQRRPLRTLVLSGRPEELAALGVTARCSVRLGVGEKAGWREVQCKGASLPFQSDVFDLVVLHHWVNQDQERRLAEVRRSMPGGSQLLVLGRGWASSGRLRRDIRREKSWRPGWLCNRLRRMGFVPRDLKGRGVAGLDLATGRGWRRALLGCSDRIAVRARRSEARTDIRLVRFSSPRAAVGQAAWDGARRDRIT